MGQKEIVEHFKNKSNIDLIIKIKKHLFTNVFIFVGNK